MISTLKNLSQKVAAGDVMDKVITVRNKCDLVQNQTENDDVVYVSAKTGFGLNQLVERIEKSVMENTDRCTVSLRVPVGGEEIRWLYKNAVVIDSECDDDVQFQNAKVVIPSGKLEQFKHYFIKGQKR